VIVLVGLGLLTAGGGVTSFVGATSFLVLYGLLARFGRRTLVRLLDLEGEALALLALALLTLVAAGALALGFPEAVAAFLLGMAVAESGQRPRVESALRSWYDVGAASFFLVVGLHVDLATALREVPLALLLVAVTVVAGLPAGFLGGRFSGLGRRAAVGHGLMLLPRGEFSLVIASLAAEAAVLPEATRQALLGATSLYVVAMVAIGSVVFARFDAVNEWLGRPLLSDVEREARAADDPLAVE